MFVYVVQHTRDLDEEVDDVKLVGVFSSESAASAAVSELLTRPGFSEHPNGFHISRYEVDHLHWADGFVTVPSDDRHEDG